jgi:diaminopimelate dehydrogenase
MAAVIRRRLVIVGLGRVGLACGKAIAASEDLAVAGIVRRPASLTQPLPPPLQGMPVATDPSEIDGIDAALICLPPRLVLETATDLLQHRIPIAESAILPIPERLSANEEIRKVARLHRTAAVTEAGWDPGMLSVFRGLFAMMTPKGHTETRDRPGVSLHHTLAARALPGIKDALCTELRAEGGRMQRYVYVELEPGADAEAAAQAVQADPLFMDEEAVVIPVGCLAELEHEGHGVVLERLGLAGGDAHQRFLLEGRFDFASVTAQIMVAAARALPMLGPGAHRLCEVPPHALWQGLPNGTEEI